MDRRLWIAALVALVVGGAVLLVRALVPDERFVYGVAAVSPAEALLLTRRNEDDSTAFWVEHVGHDGELRWSAELSPLEPHDALGFTSVDAAGDRVVVLAWGEHDDIALALDRASGRPLWERPLPPAGPSQHRIGPTVLFDGGRVYLIRETQLEHGLGERIDALSLADGAELWALAPGRSVDVHLLAPDRLLISSLGDGAEILDGATGEVSQRVELARVDCPLPEGVLGSHLGRATLVPRAADRPPWRAEPDPAWHAGGGPCGARDDDPVLGARHDTSGSAGLVRIDRETGLPRWHIDLETTLSEPVLTLDGRLPRFLPVSVYGGLAESELVVVDLDAGVVVRRAKLADHVELLATAERAWVWFQFGGVLAGLDPATGLLAGATAFKGLSGNNIRHDDLRFGALWLHGMGWARPAALPWAVVDLATGRLVRANGQVVVHDVTAETRTMLGG